MEMAETCRSYISDDVTAALSRAERSLTVTVLLDALKQTLEFEQSLAKHFGIPVCSVPVVESPLPHILCTSSTKSFSTHLTASLNQFRPPSTPIWACFWMHKKGWCSHVTRDASPLSSSTIGR